MGDELEQPRGLSWLLALNKTKLPHQIYAGTVPAATVQQRRAANKTARRSRRQNRRQA